MARSPSPEGAREPAASETIAELIATAVRERRDVRLHMADGEVLTARVLGCQDEQIVYAPLRSSHPERYAVCDSTGFGVALRDVERAQLLPAR